MVSTMLKSKLFFSCMNLSFLPIFQWPFFAKNQITLCALTVLDLLSTLAFHGSNLISSGFFILRSTLQSWAYYEWILQGSIVENYYSFQKTKCFHFIYCIDLKNEKEQKCEVTYAVCPSTTQHRHFEFEWIWTKPGLRNRIKTRPSIN